MPSLVWLHKKWRPSHQCVLSMYNACTSAKSKSSMRRESPVGSPAKNQSRCGKKRILLCLEPQFVFVMLPHAFLVNLARSSLGQGLLPEKDVLLFWKLELCQVLARRCDEVLGRNISIHPQAPC